MKKIYLLSLLFCMSFASFAQTTVNIFPVPGGAGTFKTGSSTATTRTDDDIVSTSLTEYGYSVFDISGIPSNALITSCTINFYVTGYAGAGAPSNWNTYGYVGDLSAVATPATLFGDMTSGTNISTATYGTAIGNQSIASSLGITSFVQANAGVAGQISICWTGGGTRTYTIKGETGVAATSPTINHQPYLQVTYCTAPTGVTAVASPNPVCENASLTLTSAGSFTGTGSLSYAWTGPNSYSSAVPSPSFTASLLSAGVYSLTVTHNCPLSGTSVSVNAATMTVTVNPAPAAITGNTAICKTGLTTTLLSDATGTGTWKSSNTLIATVSPGGTVTAVNTGAATISYILPGTGCYAVSPMAVNAAPTAILGPTNVCEGLIINLSDAIGSGVWSSNAIGTASVVATGDVTGVAAGLATISYTVPGCTPATSLITVNATPPGITGGPNVCIGFTTPTTFSDAMGGGTWSASNTSAAFGVTPFDKNKLYGSTVGIDTITYTSPSGCIATMTVTVDPALTAITGSPTTICQYQTTTLSDGTPSGIWSTSGTVASVNSAGVVTGLAGGTANITYSVGACSVKQAVTIQPGPSPIVGPTVVCQNDSFFLSDAVSGQVWSSSVTSLATIGSSSGFVRTINSGSDSFYYSNKVTGCWTALVVNIKSSPSATITTSGPTTFCTGGSVSLSVPIGGTLQYQWFTSGTAMTTATTNIYPTDSTQTVTVRVINTVTGCTTTSAPILVISGISPTISLSSGNDTFCQGGHAIMTANANGTVGLISYQWMLNGLNILTATGPTYTATTGGGYACVVSVSGSSGTCIVPTSIVSLVSLPAPIPPITYSTHLLTTDNTYSGYQWFLNNIAIPGATHSTYNPAGNGSYRVLVTNAKGCTGSSTTIMINSVGVQEINKVDVKIYPNPASSILHIESSVTVNAVITSIEGKTMMHQANARDMNISSLAKGIYMIMLFDESGNRLSVEKLIKE